MVRQIHLPHGLVARVDDDDFEWLNQHQWFLAKGTTRGYYAGRRVNVDGKTVQLYMHREILAVPAGLFVDHIDRDPLNNCRSNLRVATRQQNLCNKFHAHQASGFKGVFPHRRRFRARIQARGKTHNLGSYGTAREAAEAYDAAAILLHGEFAALNFPERAVGDQSAGGVK